MRLLVVEDEAALASALREGLEAAGFAVDVCSDGEAALALASTEPYVTIVLDRMLPKLDGLTVCRRLRAARSETPVLLLTALDAIEARVEGLDAGADDYLTKPFALSELVARVRALSRRTAATRTNLLVAQDLVLDTGTGRVTRGAREVSLSAKELRLLTVLLRHPGRLVSHARLVEEAWGLDEPVTPDVVRVHVKNLRKKLADGGRGGLIETVHGLGYRVVA